jgi:hypothetical protein
VARHQRLKFPPGQQKAGDSIRLIRGLNEKFAHPSNEVPLVVVRFRTHQFCGVQLHLPPLSPSSGRGSTLLEAFEQKKPAHRKTSRPRASASTKWTYL